MRFREVSRELKKRGTAGNRRIYGRHGVREPMHGVSFANLRDLKKRIKIDQELAVELWDSGNHDCRVLATMIADPKAIRALELERWVRDLDNYVLADAFSGLVARTPLARSRADKWTASRKEFIGQAGYNVLGLTAMNDDESPNDYFQSYLEKIEDEIHGSANRVRHAMNQALIAIALRSPALRRKAVAAAKRIGKVEVDHGETSCKTPDAVAYIDRCIAARGAKKAKDRSS
jgi:3-methyladenine DNA glycosylase AlkD